MNGDPPRTISDYLKLKTLSAMSDGLSGRTIKRAIAAGELPAFRPSGAPRGLILVRRVDFVRWIEQGRIDTATQARSSRRLRRVG